MSGRIAVVMILFLLAAPTARGDEVVKWVDADGVVHYTDTVAEVPARYRDRFERKSFDEEKPVSTVMQESERPATAKRDLPPPDYRKKRGTATGKALQLTGATFDRSVLKTKGPVLVDFWEPWCGHCRRIAPFLDEMAGLYQGRLTVAKINTETYPAVKRAYGVAAFPTLIFFEEGKITYRVAGGPTREGMIEMIEDYLRP